MLPTTKCISDFWVRRLLLFSAWFLWGLTLDFACPKIESILWFYDDSPYVLPVLIEYTIFQCPDFCIQEMKLRNANTVNSFKVIVVGRQRAQKEHAEGDSCSWSYRLHVFKLCTWKGRQLSRSTSPMSEQAALTESLFFPVPTVKVALFNQQAGVLCQTSYWSVHLGSPARMIRTKWDRRVDQASVRSWGIV